MSLLQGHAGWLVVARCRHAVHAESPRVVPGWSRHNYYMGATRVRTGLEQGQSGDDQAEMMVKSAFWT